MAKVLPSGEKVPSHPHFARDRIGSRVWASKISMLSPRCTATLLPSGENTNQRQSPILSASESAHFLDAISHGRIRSRSHSDTSRYFESGVNATNGPILRKGP